MNKFVIVNTKGQLSGLFWHPQMEWVNLDGAYKYDALEKENIQDFPKEGKWLDYETVSAIIAQIKMQDSIYEMDNDGG